MPAPAAYPDLYEVLGTTPEAASEDLEAAYRDRARKLERDPEAERRLRELEAAFTVLSRPDSRSLYDRVAHGYAPRADEPAPPQEARDDSFIRYVAAAALVVSIVFLIFVLLA